MISLFGRIRKKLADENKPVKYLRYAVGEVFLVVFGILIALQLDNWNDARKNEDQFRAVLQQIFTVIDQDADQLGLMRYDLTKQITIIDTIRLHPERINPKLLPHLLFYIDLEPSDLTSEVSYQLSYLNFNPENLKQSNLNKSLAAYGNDINLEFNINPNLVTPFLEKLNLPYPGLLIGYSVLNNFQNIDTTYFSKSAIESSEELLEDPLFQNALKSSRSRKALELVQIENLIELTTTNKTMIRDYYPGVKLLYANISLVGDATQNNNWTKNLPLALTNDIESIWEADVELKNGFVKFREGENWNFNWGGDEFPASKCQSYGNNINVEAGKYHVIFNLTDKSYQFIKQDD